MKKTCRLTFRVTLSSKNPFDALILDEIGCVTSGIHLKKIIYDMIVAKQSINGPQRDSVDKKTSQDNQLKDNEIEILKRKTTSRGASTQDIMGDWMDAE